jgi:hypothetical protein
MINENGYQQGKAWKSTMPAIHTIVGSRLSPGSHGNAIGVGLCEFITQRFDEQIEWDRTTLNSLSALCPARPTDRSSASTIETRSK